MNLAKIIYDSYPVDVFVRPEAAVDMRTLFNTVMKGDSGDTLFDFIVREVRGSDKDEALRLLYQAQEHLQAVVTAIENTTEQETSDE